MGFFMFSFYIREGRTQVQWHVLVLRGVNEVPSPQIIFWTNKNEYMSFRACLYEQKKGFLVHQKISYFPKNWGFDS